jgi:hypothetical protein
MNINISKGDINEHLWFQKMLEVRLHAETLRRAIEAGHVPPEVKELWCFEVGANYSADAVEATYAVGESHRRQDIENYCESYTLAEAMRLARTDTPPERTADTERATVLAYLRAAYSPNTIVPLPDFLAALLRMVEKGEHHRKGNE